MKVIVKVMAGNYGVWYFACYGRVCATIRTSVWRTLGSLILQAVSRL